MTALALAGRPARLSVAPGRHSGARTEHHESVDGRDYQHDPAEPWANDPEGVSLRQHEETSYLYGQGERVGSKYFPVPAPATKEREPQKRHPSQGGQGNNWYQCQDHLTDPRPGSGPDCILCRRTDHFQVIARCAVRCPRGQPLSDNRRTATGADPRWISYLRPALGAPRSHVLAPAIQTVVTGCWTSKESVND